MSSSRPLHPAQAERIFTAMLDEAGLPRHESSRHDPDHHLLDLTWDHGLTLHFDLNDGVIEPISEFDREAILGNGFACGCGPIDVYVPGAPDDPREEVSIPGVRIRRGPPLHPDDVTVHLGLPVTTPSRTLIDLAEVLPREELREAFSRARELGLLDPDALRASRARVEWRPSLAILDEVIEEFCED